MADQKNMVLDVENLNVKFVLEEETVEAVNGISLQIREGETLGLVGETGAGKTTTALSILRLIDSPPGVMECDKLEVCGEDILHMSVAELEHTRGSLVSMIFQDPMTSLNPVFTVGYQIAESLERHEHLNKQEAWEKAEDMLELVGIPRERAIEYPHQFSGGMKQRVIIAIALACSPKLLIADEPTTALDVTIQAQILELMRGLQETYNSSLLMITHNLGIISELCQKTAVIYAGRIIEYGPTEEVFAHPAHPYTVGLLKSLPSLEGKRERLLNIPGSVASAQDLPEGCCFHPRCSHCTEECKHCVPKMKHVNGSHTVACFHSEGGMNK